MANRLRTVLHNTEEKPSLVSHILLGIQLLTKFSIMVMFPLLVAEYAGATPADTANFISISLIAGAVGTVIQALIKPKIAAGQLLPTFTSVPYFIASLSAAQIGGLSLVLGMTIIGSLIQLALTPFIRRLGFIFTKDSAAFILIMLGFWLGGLGIQEFFNPSALGQLALHSKLSMDKTPLAYKMGAETIGCISLFVMVILRLWSPQKLRLYCILIGIVVGWMLAGLNNFIPSSHIQRIFAANWIQFPHFIKLDYTFSLSLLFPFVLAALGSCFDFFALFCANQGGVDREWSEPDFKSIRKGNFWASANSVVAGLVGSVAQSPLPGAVGISIATGTYSRTIAYVFALLLLLLSFCPKIIAVFLTIPAAINGAALVFIGASIFMLGVNMMNLQSADTRKTYALGISFLVAASSNIIPAIYNPFPNLGIIATDPALLLGLFCFIILTTLFSIKSTVKN